LSVRTQACLRSGRGIEEGRIEALQTALLRTPDNQNGGLNLFNFISQLNVALSEAENAGLRRKRLYSEIDEYGELSFRTIMIGPSVLMAKGIDDIR